MQRQSWKLALIVALGSVLLGGCANFKWKGGENSLGSPSRDNAAANAESENIIQPKNIKVRIERDMANPLIIA